MESSCRAIFASACGRTMQFLSVGVIVCVSAALGSCSAYAPRTEHTGAPANPAPAGSPNQAADDSQAADAPVLAGSSACADPAAATHPELSEGTSTVYVCLDETGTLLRDPVIARSSGSCRLDEGAIRLAKTGSGHYQPAMLDDKPVPGCVTFEIHFKLKTLANENTRLFRRVSPRHPLIRWQTVNRSCRPWVRRRTQLGKPPESSLRSCANASLHSRSVHRPELLPPDAS